MRGVVALAGNAYFGYWLLAIGYWLLAIGYWLLAIGYWLPVLSEIEGLAVGY